MKKTKKEIKELEDVFDENNKDIFFKKILLMVLLIGLISFVLYIVIAVIDVYEQISGIFRVG